MSENYILAQIWISLVAIISINCLILLPQRAEACRSRMRAIRDDLFDYMWENGHSFSNEGYQETRQIINGILRLSSMIGPFLLIALIAKYGSQSRNPDALSSMNDSPLKKRLKRARQDSIREFLGFVFLEGSFGVFMKFIFFVCKIVRLAVNAKAQIRKRSEFLFDFGREFGTPNLSSNQQSLIGN